MTFTKRFCLNLTNKLNISLTKLFSDTNVIYIVTDLENEIEALEVNIHKLTTRIKALARGDKLTKEMFDTLKGKNCKSCCEIKIKPHRIGVLRYSNNYILLSCWKVQSNRSKKKSEDINNACLKCKEILNEINRVSKN